MLPLGTAEESALERICISLLVAAQFLNSNCERFGKVLYWLDSAEYDFQAAMPDTWHLLYVGLKPLLGKTYLPYFL